MSKSWHGSVAVVVASLAATAIMACVMDDTGQCGNRRIVCGAGCIDPMTDSYNCGSCGTVCQPGEVCRLGVCTVECGLGTTLCANSCVDTETDPAHCGGCHQPCDPGVACVAGVCGGACPEGSTNCSGRCVDLSSDPEHCGGCDRPCAAEQACFDGACRGSVCEPSVVEYCYSGDPSTVGVGQCRPGTKTCNAEGTGFSPCEGEVLPDVEDCANHLDEDCDGLTPVCLDQSGLITRYFIDEAGTGMTPTQLEDAAQTPLPLVIDWASGMYYGEWGGNRALNWNTTNLDGRAWTLVDNTKVAALHGSTAGTIELVLDVDDITSNQTRFSHIGVAGDNRFTLGAEADDEVEFIWQGSTRAGLWPINLRTAPRIVLHLVLDTTLANPIERARLYRDGGIVAKLSGVDPIQNQTIDIGAGAHYSLGGRIGANITMDGRLYYGALCGQALTEEQVQHNTTLLLASDDTP